MRRLIFTLLYDQGEFMLSRNFRLQQVGDVGWLFRNYDFASVSQGLDELMVIDVSRGARNAERFSETVQQIAGQCFIPITVGGGINDMETAHLYMRCGADKLLINSAFESNPALVTTLANHFGRQCIVAGIDFRTDRDGNRTLFAQNGDWKIASSLSNWVDFLQETGAGEIVFQSIDRDGTGMGLDTTVLEELVSQPEVPCILMGGVGKTAHILEGLQTDTVDAVATANLFNFIASTFLDVREAVSAAGIKVPKWQANEFANLKHTLADENGEPTQNDVPVVLDLATRTIRGNRS